MLHLFFKRTLLFVTLFSITVLSFVFYIKQTPEPEISLNESNEIWVITVPHHLSPSLQDNGVAFQKMQATAAGKDIIIGTKVLVEPGNHDIADGWAQIFIGEQTYKTRPLTASEFLSLLSPLNTVYF